MHSLEVVMPAETTQAELEAKVDEVSADPAIHGLIVQMPLPKQIDSDRVIAAIDPAKDVDGLHPISTGLQVSGRDGLVPCTPSGCMLLIKEAFGGSSGGNIVGAEAVVIGRSILVGKPMAALLTNASATVTVAHSRTRDLAGHVARADIVVAGGTEAAIHQLTMSGFSAMRALSTRNDDPNAASHPYDIDRDGFVMGEGAGALVLESEEFARARGARIYAYVAGAGLTADGHHIAQPDPEGLGAARAMRYALEEADLSPLDIVHVNAHATSTPQGDVAEAMAIRSALGAKSQAIISATKSMTGHMLGGAGSVESVFTILALYHRLAPPTANLHNIDPQVDLDVTRSQPRPLPAGDIAALKNSFGFGGHDIAVAFRSA
jgi:3-oxoacyl-[acyl-carrier-protein] synthase II